jgi:predicted kinase
MARIVGAKILRTDELRRELFQECTYEELLRSKNKMKFDIEGVISARKNIPKKIYDEYQKLIWKQKEIVYNVLFQKASKYLLENENLILDGTFFKRDLREKAYDIAEEVGCKVYVIECFCSEKAIKKRLEKRKKLPDEPSHANELRVYKILKEKFESPLKDGVPLIRYNTEKHSIKEYNVRKANKIELEMIRNSIMGFAKHNRMQG